MSRLIQCIYCLEDRSANEFNREHVLPRAWGTFSDDVVLREMVCMDCNKYFADQLENSLARGTMEGLMRFQKGIKSPSEFKPASSANTFKITVNEDGNFSGSRLFLNPPSVDGLKPYSPDQLGIKLRGSDEYQYFLLEEIPSFPELKLDRNYDLDHKKSLHVLSHNPPVVVAALLEKGINFNTSEELFIPEDKRVREVPMRVEVRFDEIKWRAIAKIAFNYLAWVTDADFVLQKCFDDFRRYVRYGETNEPFVSIEREPILQDEKFSESRRNGHIITVDRDRTSREIFSQLTLMNMTTFKIRFANLCDSSIFQSKGHFFDFKAHLVHEINPFSSEVINLFRLGNIAIQSNSDMKLPFGTEWIVTGRNF